LMQLLLFVFFSYLLCCARGSSVDPARVHFIDHNSTTNNFLFRAGLPLNATGFAYDEMLQLFTAVAKQQANLTVPQDALMVVICLLSFEVDQIHNESVFFEENPNLGSFLLWPILGAILDPDIVSEQKRVEYALDLSKVMLDDLPAKLSALRTALSTPLQKPVLYFVHCDEGMDRTGEVSGAYYMTYQNMSFGAAMILDDHINTDLNRSITCFAEWAFEWYCLHQLYTKQYSLDNCTVPSDLPFCTV